MNIKIGAHLSIAGGYNNPLKKIIEMGGNSLQIFSTSPRGWSFASPNPEEITDFIVQKKQLNVEAVFFHASYLVNLGNHERGGEISVRSLIHELKLAAKMGIRGSIIHLGSFKNHGDDSPTKITDQENFSVLIKNISEILANTPEDTYFIIENAGNRKIGRTLEEIGEIITAVNNSRIKVCLDTCHLHAAGYDLSTMDKLNTFLDLFDSLIGLKKLELLHINDSRDPLGSLRDRHDNIGQGNVGINVFKNILNHEKLNHLPFIIETPGFDDMGPDKKNLDILKSLIG